MKLQAKTSVYHFDLDDIKGMIAENLEVDPSKVSVHYRIEEVGGDYMDRFPGTKQVTRIEVTVKE